MFNNPLDQNLPTNAVAKPEKGASSRAYNFVDLAISVFLLSILGLLCANVYVIYQASCYNDSACQEALYSVASAFDHGADVGGMMQAARETLTTCGGGGFFIEHPQFTKFRYEKLPLARLFVVGTSTSARPPAPWLIANQDIFRDGKLTISRTYVLHMTHLKKERDN